MKITNEKLMKLSRKAMSYARENNLSVENYVPTDIEISANNVDIICTNEYGGRYGICYIPNAANVIFSYRELKALAE